MSSGLHHTRTFCPEGIDPFDTVEWEGRTAEIKDGKGAVVFRQEGFRVPKPWSSLATNVVAQKYAHGPLDAPGRESGADAIIRRVTATIRSWAGPYFDSPESADAFEADLAWLCIHQHGSFNSPVWFNVGVTSERSEGWCWDDYLAVDGGIDLGGGQTSVRIGGVRPPRDGEHRPQGSACFLQDVSDDMGSIMDLAKSEAMLFKRGSGTGTNLSRIRSTKERLSGGGRPSGPVSFFKVYDGVAGIVKSGGKTRRAARLNCLDCWHPDVMEFVDCKVKAERLAKTLVACGYDGSLDGEVYASIPFQNTNISVRVTDEFMRLVESASGSFPLRAVTTGEVIGHVDPPTLIRKVAEGTWECGDPGLQYHTTINLWHTCPEDGEIAEANPCAEYNFLPNSACNLASLNLMSFRRPDGTFDAPRFADACAIFLTAQEILVDNVSYPTAKIAENSHRFRPLGLGYANLGALLMTSGLAYDSDDGRQLAAAVTSVMNGAALKRSAEMAREMGAYEGFARNREHHLRVAGMHRDAAGDLPASPIAMLGLELHQESIELAERHGYRNAQATLLAPTGCATPDTLILTDRGLRRLGSLGDESGSKWQDVRFRVQTDEGPRDATKFYVNGLASIVEVETDRGHSIRATPEHRIKVVGRDGSWRWARMGELSEGDLVPMKLGGMIGDPAAVPLPPLGTLDPRATPFETPAEMGRDLAELLGAFQANGSIHAKGVRISVFKHDAALIERTVELFAVLFGLRAAVDPDGDAEVVAVTVNSMPLTRWWEEAGFGKIRPDGHRGKGLTSRVPDAVLATNDPLVYAAFLRGYADHDGTVSDGCPEVMNKDRRFVEDLKAILLALGIATNMRSTIGGKSGKPVWRARLLNRTYCALWQEIIGFTEQRKSGAVVCGNDSRGDIIPVPRDVLDEVCPIGHRSRRTAMVAVGRRSGLTRNLVRSLYAETGDPRVGHLLGFVYDRVLSATLAETLEPTYDISVPENVTYVANGFVSHNTIAFKMDCDTTGVEPDIALVKYKTLAGGGMLKLTNRLVPEALRVLGYEPEHIEAILKAIEAGDPLARTQGGLIDDEDLPVFATAFGTPNIHWRGHVEMMAAVQPFLSGAISKTVNMPESATVGDIVECYLLGWRRGLKALAIFRDNSKGVQPVRTSPDSPEVDKVATLCSVLPDRELAAQILSLRGRAEVAEAVIGRQGLMSFDGSTRREKLPETRYGMTGKFRVAGFDGYATANTYPDGRVGELFVTAGKDGSTVAGLLDWASTCFSLALQHGCPLEKLVEHSRGRRFEPHDIANSSIPDAVAKWLQREFLDGQDDEHAAVPGAGRPFDGGDDEGPGPDGAPRIAAREYTRSVFQPDHRHPTGSTPTGKTCPNCGGLCFPNGSKDCFACPGCGANQGACGG